MKKLVFALSLLAFTPASAIAAADFTKVDANGDGQVTMDELTAAGVNWTKDRFTAADTDQNGALSKAEYDVAGG